MQPCRTHTTNGLWYTYIVLCSDGTLYTGVTTNPVRRVAEHNSARRGARYTRARQPVRLVFLEQQPSRSAACKRECAIKDMSATDKKFLINGRHDTADRMPPRLMA